MGDAKESPTAKKLTILLPYLLTHNDEHAREMEKWSKKAQEDGNSAVAEELKEAFTKMEKISGHLKTAITLLGSKTVDDHHEHHHPHDHDDHHHN
jgi:hypothetical protein